LIKRKKKIVTVVGARPQFIKAATVSRALSLTGAIDERILHTGQHYDDNMSKIFFKSLCIPEPHFNLEIGSGRHGSQTGEMLKEIERVLIAESPDAVVVYGDTNSTLAGALAAAKLHIPIAHVEAGLRSFNKKMPEEINRILTDHVSTWLFAPTSTAVENLNNEGISPSSIFLCGDVMYDTIKFYEERSASVDLPLVLDFDFILATIHRSENTDDPVMLKSIFNALDKISKKIPVVIPLHPRTKKCLQSLEWRPSSDKLFIIEPVGYLEMIKFQQRCGLIITDSGGVQKEAYFMGKYCITLRPETEWIELVNHGFNNLSSAADLEIWVEKRFNHKFDPLNDALYGYGDASHKIAEVLSGM
jgi:UDP-GlcNAc3NAcA epimerase